MIFKKFNDKGWIFSKLIGIGILGIILWLTFYMKILSFSIASCWIAVILFGIFGAIIVISKHNKQQDQTQLCELIKEILKSEIVFCVALIAFTYLRNFNVSINCDTEKYMDFGYMNSIFYSKYMPVEDIWFSGHSINYYYFGQYISAFVTKLSFLNPPEGYNMMIALIGALSFSLPCSIGYNLGLKLIEDKMRKQKRGK